MRNGLANESRSYICKTFSHYMHNILLWHNHKEQTKGLSFYAFNTLRPRQNGRQFPDNILKCTFLNENVWILIKTLLHFSPKGQINKIAVGSDNGLAPARWQAIIWTNNSLLTHICVARPQWVDRNISQCVEATGLGDWMMVSLWNLTSTMAVMLWRQLSEQLDNY